MATHPEVDLVVVALRVPLHRGTVLAAVGAGKPVLCEWPLATSTAEADEMRVAAARASIRTFVGMQGRSDPAIAHARDLLADGAIGSILSADVDHVSTLQVQCKPTRAWMARRSGGATTLTIHGGHVLDMLCGLVGDFSEVQARLSTRVPTWSADDGAAIDVDSPDTCLVLGGLHNGVQVSVAVRAVPYGQTGCKIVIYGSRGVLSLTSDGPASVGPMRLTLQRGPAAPEDVTPRDRYRNPGATVSDRVAVNVAHAYSRIASHWDPQPHVSSTRSVPDFAEAVQLHRLIDAIEKSAKHGTSVMP